MTAPDVKRLLVTGCGRSGTKYTSFVLRRLGLDVPHERLGRDGVAAWTMAVRDPRRPYGPAGELDFEHVFHQVRHPLRVIASAMTFGDASWSFICVHTSCDPEEPLITRSARYWLEWNEHAERVAGWRYRVEALPEALPELCDRLGVRYVPGALARVPSDVNTRRSSRVLHVAEELLERLRLDMPPSSRAVLARAGRPRTGRVVSWEEVERADATLARRVREASRRFGYEE